MNRGKLIVLGMFGLALLAIVFACWYLYQRDRRVMALWKPEGVRLIQNAGRAKGPGWMHLLQLAPVGSASPLNAAESLSIGKDEYVVVNAKDTAGLPGADPWRIRLVEDASFDWNAAEPAAAPIWQYAMRFATDRNVHLTLVFDFQGRRVMALERESPAELLGSTVAAELEKFFDGQFPKRPAPK